MTILRDLSIIWSYIHVLILFMFLFEPRYSRKKNAFLITIFMVPLCIMNIALYIISGPEKAAQIVMITCTIPSLIFSYIIARHRDGRLLFSFCLADTVTYEVIVVTSLLDHYIFGNQYIFMLVSRLILFPVMEFAAWKYLRKPYLQLQKTVQKGWYTFAGTAALFYVLLIVMSAYPVIMFEQPAIIFPLCLVMVLMPLTYINIYKSLTNQHRLYLTHQRQQFLNLQTFHMKQQIEHSAEREKHLRIFRHDMRHRLHTIAAMLVKKDYEEALAFLDISDQQLDPLPDIRWCANPTLDAVFSLYLKRAEQEQIHIEADIKLPETIPFNASELAIVFANALENAIIANLRLPAEERIIRIKCLCKPQYMFRISNPYVDKIVLDSHGIPVGHGPGHGIGTQSIIAFCEKYHAHYEYQTQNNLFSLSIVMK